MYLNNLSIVSKILVNIVQRKDLLSFCISQNIHSIIFLEYESIKLLLLRISKPQIHWMKNTQSIPQMVQILSANNFCQDTEIVLRLRFSWSTSSIFNFMDTLKVSLDLGEVVLHFCNFTQDFKLIHYYFATFLSRIPSPSGFFKRPEIRKKCLAKWEITNLDTKRQQNKRSGYFGLYQG